MAHHIIILAFSEEKSSQPVGVGQGSKRSTNAGCNALGVAKMSFSVLASFEEQVSMVAEVHGTPVAELSVQVMVEVQINILKAISHGLPLDRALLVHTLHKSHVLFQNVQNSYL